MKLLVSCMGGPNQPQGLYSVDTDSGEQRQIVDVEGRGLARIDNGYALAHPWGIVRLDDQFNVVEETKARPQDFHGAAVLDGKLYVVHTMQDRIGVYSTDPINQQNLLAPLHYSPAINHHMNDISVDGDSLLVSMFSTSSSWRADWEAGTWRGTIMRFNPADPAGTVERLATGLRMPHSVKLLNGKLCYCESYDLSFVAGDKRYKVNGYTRGLAFDGRFYYVGLSVIRHEEKDISRFDGAGELISTGTVVIIDGDGIDSDRRIELPAQHVYDILVVD